MALDGLLINKLINELNNKINNKKINKIFQFNNDNIILDFRDFQLLLSANATYPRLHLTNNSFKADEKQSNFIQNMRKYLLGAILTNIYQEGLDRVITFEFLALNDFKEKVTIKLILEIMGKYSNLIIVDSDNMILDSFIHVTSFMSSKRVVMPKTKYIRILEQEKFEILDFINNENSNDDSYKNLTNTFKEVSCDNLVKFLTTTFYGISKQIALDFSSKSNNTSFEDFIKYIKELYSESALNPAIYFEKDIPIDFHIFNLEPYKELKRENMISISNMLELFYTKKAISNNIKAQSTDIKLLLSNAMTKAMKKKVIHTTNIEESKNAEIYKTYGDLIFSNIYSIKKGVKVTSVTNYYDDNNLLEIKLDENLTPSENANKYYKKFNKSKSTLKNAILQLKEIDEEIVYLETVMSYLENALTLNDLESIREELAESGYLKKKIFLKNNKNKSKNKKEESKPLKFISSDNFEIYVGKNNIQNDEITFKIGKDSDVWMHVQDIPGSHVIIKTNGLGLESIPETTLIEAANIGIFYSKGRESTKVPIDYTERRYVKKPSGAKPGFVIFLNNKTLYITPNKDILSRFNIC